MEEIANQKQKLEAEKKLLEKELSTVGRVNPENPADWEAKGSNFDTLNADENEVADTIEEYEANTAILKQLETRYNEVKSALLRIEEGSYGICSVCGKPIEQARLAANPAATTCQDHM